MTNTLPLTARQGLIELRSLYRDGLLGDTMPFWLDNENCIDRMHGGFLHAFDRDGALVDTDKAMWIQGRFTWLLAHLYNVVDARGEWLDAARHGIEFMEGCGYDADGRMFFRVTRDGRPLIKRRYVYTEAFAAMAYAEYARAAGSEEHLEKARALYGLVQHHLDTPGLLVPKVNAAARPMRTQGVPMLMIVVTQTMRDADPENASQYTAAIDRYISDFKRYFLKEDRKIVMETVGEGGSLIDSFDGRLLNPGHALETGWFVLEESRMRGGDAALDELGANVIDWMLESGWDSEYGGMIYYRDVAGFPIQEYWHDMKFWWPQNEAIVAALLAFERTGDVKFAKWHQKVHDWAYAHFPDPEYGEWFGYLHRDGRLSSTLKGNMWKGPFHLPRMQLRCWQSLDRMTE